MTLPQERAKAVLDTYQFLRRLSTPYDGGIKGIKGEVRREARSLLRHYPGIHDLLTVSDKCPDTFWLQRNEVDG